MNHLGLLYQEILQEGVQQGLQQGRQAEASALILRQLNRRFGGLAPVLETRIRGLSMEQLEGLAEALLDFGTVADLQHWLGQEQD